MIEGGDYNTELRKDKNPRSDKELAAFREVMKDAFDLSEDSVPLEERITHSYFPSNKPGTIERHQLDAFMINGSPRIRVLSMKIISYTDKDGRAFPLPMSYQERSRQPSDHNAIFMTFSVIMP